MCACHKNHSVGCIKNESNCLLENKMVSTLIWGNVILLYVVQSNILWLTFKLSYHYRCNILCTVSFLLYIATKKFKQNHYCKQFYECSYHKKNNSCTLCVPMLWKGHCGRRVFSLLLSLFDCEQFHSLRTYRTSELELIIRILRDTEC